LEGLCTQSWSFSLLGQRSSTPANAGPVNFLLIAWHEAQLEVNNCLPSCAKDDAEYKKQINKKQYFTGPVIVVNRLNLNISQNLVVAMLGNSSTAAKI
jgi:hypothetical protein